MSSSIGAGLGGQTGNNGRIWINLKPFAERDLTAQGVIARLRGKLQQVEGMNVFLQAAQDINVGGRLARTQYQYTLQSADLAELYDWSPRILAKMRDLPMLRDLADGPAGGGHDGDAHHRPGPRGPVRNPAAGD